MDNLTQIANLNLSEIDLTSRSGIECYQECPRQRYFNYHVLGTGIVPNTANIFLSTGIAIHKGCELLAKRAKKNKSSLPTDVKEYRQVWINEAVGEALDYYNGLVKNGISGKGTGVKEEEKEFIYHEQISLVEALIRAWGLRELPQLCKRFYIREVEVEELQQLKGRLWLQGKADLILAERENGDSYVYSLKTTKQFDWRAEKSYRSDLQGLTEVWLAEGRFKKHNEKVNEAITKLKEIGSKVVFSQMVEVLQKQYLPTRVSGVKFCFLIKGERREDKDSNGEGTGLYRTYSPLIRGYRKFEAGEIQYAHSWWFANPNNKSGKGSLGRGWEAFDVWENKEVGGVKGWINKLAKKTIQPECGDILKESVVTPVEYMRSQVEMEEGIKEITSQELMVFDYLRGLEDGEFQLHETFPKFRRSCWYPTDCEYVKICHQGKTVEEMLEGEEMIRRTPHHEMEAKQLREKVAIKEEENVKS